MSVYRVMISLPRADLLGIDAHLNEVQLKLTRDDVSRTPSLVVDGKSKEEVIGWLIEVRDRINSSINKATA